MTEKSGGEREGAKSREVECRRLRHTSTGDRRKSGKDKVEIYNELETDYQTGGQTGGRETIPTERGWETGLFLGKKKSGGDCARNLGGRLTKPKKKVVNSSTFSSPLKALSVETGKGPQRRGRKVEKDRFSHRRGSLPC